jgi:hypothetical protein
MTTPRDRTLRDGQTPEPPQPGTERKRVVAVPMEDRYVPRSLKHFMYGGIIPPPTLREIVELGKLYRDKTPRKVLPTRKVSTLGTKDAIIDALGLDNRACVPMKGLVFWGGKGLQGTLEHPQTLLSFQVYKGTPEVIGNKICTRIGAAHYTILSNGTPRGAIYQKKPGKTSQPLVTQFKLLNGENGISIQDLQPILEKAWENKPQAEVAIHEAIRTYNNYGGLHLFPDEEDNWEVIIEVINHFIRKYRAPDLDGIHPLIRWARDTDFLDGLDDPRIVWETRGGTEEDEDEEIRILSFHRDFFPAQIYGFQFGCEGERGVRSKERTVFQEAWDLLVECVKAGLPLILPSWWTTDGVTQNNGPLRRVCMGGKALLEGTGIWSAVENQRCLIGNEHWNNDGDGTGTCNTEISDYPAAWIDQYIDVLNRCLKFKEEFPGKLSAYYKDNAAGIIGGLPVLAFLEGHGWYAIKPMGKYGVWVEDPLDRNHMSIGMKPLAIEGPESDSIRTLAITTFLERIGGEQTVKRLSEEFPFLQRGLNLSRINNLMDFLKNGVRFSISPYRKTLYPAKEYTGDISILGGILTLQRGGWGAEFGLPKLSILGIDRALWGEDLLPGGLIAGSKTRWEACYRCNRAIVSNHICNCREVDYVTWGRSRHTGRLLDLEDDPYPPYRCKKCDTRLTCECEERCLVCGGGCGNKCTCTAGFKYASKIVRNNVAQWKGRNFHPQGLIEAAWDGNLKTTRTAPPLGEAQVDWRAVREELAEALRAQMANALP